MDPDRFVQYSTSGAQEWWYFDAISDDGRDALVLVWYAGLPFDPAYGVAALKHLQRPDRYPQPHALDHSALGVSLYRDGKTIAYALNAFGRDQFRCTPEPFSIDIAGNLLAREANGYRLEVATPAVDGRTPLRASLTFAPASATRPVERELGTSASPHLWVLAAPDCRVEGTFHHGDRAIPFRGRGYHDHNAGSEEISRAMKRWVWGRFHNGPLTEIYYGAEPREGAEARVWITCRDGLPETIREDVAFTESPDRGGNVFGIRHGRSLRVGSGSETFTDPRALCVDDGPFYRRWHSPPSPGQAPGISEILVTKNLNRPLFNWMIPYRLKRPAPAPKKNLS